MNSYLIDINVWLALSWGLHPFSKVAHQWLAELPAKRTRLIFSRVTQLGLIRLLTNELVMGESVLTIQQALDLYDRWIQDPRVDYSDEPQGVEAAFRRATSGFAAKPATKVVMDAYLVGFAGSQRATLVTLDKALSKIASSSKISYHFLASHSS